MVVYTHGSAQMSLIVLIALMNLALGFATAVLMGRGPWSHRVRRFSAKQRASSSEDHLVQPNRVVKSLADFVPELERAEQQFQTAATQFADESTTVRPTPAVLRSIVQLALDQFDSLSLERDSITENSQQKSIGIEPFVTLLRSARETLTPTEESSDKSQTTDFCALANNLASACREARGVVDALIFPQQAEVKTLSS